MRQRTISLYAKLCLGNNFLKKQKQEFLNNIYMQQLNLVHTQYISPVLRRLAKATNEGARSLMWLGGTRSCKTSSMMQLCGWHATGVYPDGITSHQLNETAYTYDGYKYERPVRILVVALKNIMARDILQEYLLKGVASRPPDLLTITDTSAKSGVKGLYEKIHVPHFTKGQYDGQSEIIFKSVEEGSQSFQGYNAIDCIFIDEEPKYDVFKECLNRLAAMGTRKTFLFLSQWPVNGKSEVVNYFYQNKNKDIVEGFTFYTQSGWKQNPFLSETEIEKMKLDYPAWELPARMEGVPTFGQGKVFGFLVSNAHSIIVEDIDFANIPEHWNLIGGIDPAATSNGTWGACLIAEDPTTRNTEGDALTHGPIVNIGTVYIVKEYLMTDKVLDEHGMNLRTMFNHLPGIPLVCDPAGGGENEERKSALEYLRDTEKLNILVAEKVNQAKNRAIQKIWMLHNRGKFKICRSCIKTLEQFEQYARDENNKIIKQNDHIVDACFYALNKIEEACCKNELFKFKGTQSTLQKWHPHIKTYTPLKKNKHF